MEEFKHIVTNLLDEALAIREDLFLIELKIDAKIHVSIIIDGDQGVNLKDCIEISRAVEHNIDSEVFDFSLDVSSPGAFSDIVFPRQYSKNIGRWLHVETASDEKFEGELISFDNDSINLKWETRENKKVGKGKETVQHTREINISKIIKAKVVFK
jgi:ribosome maturation factor RimP